MKQKVTTFFEITIQKFFYINPSMATATTNWQTYETGEAKALVISSSPFGTKLGVGTENGSVFCFDIDGNQLKNRTLVTEYKLV